MISFRTRLFAIATLIVALVLAVVFALGWSRVMAYEVERLDARLCQEARRLARPLPPGAPLRSLENDLLGKLRLNRSDQLLARIDAADGRVIFQSSQWHEGLQIDRMAWESVPPPPPPPRSRAPAAEPPPPAPCALASFSDQGAPWRAALFSAPDGRGFVAADLAPIKSELQGTLRAALWLVIPLALALIAAGAAVLSAVAMRPVNRLREAMKQVTQKELAHRLPSQGEDREFTELIHAYNAMLARLEANFQQASRFSADAAHELKTPLTILQGRIEQTLNEQDNPQLQHVLSLMQEEVSRLTAITRKLLLLSQADAGRLTLQRQRIDLSALLDELASDTQMLAAEQQVSSQVARHLFIDGDSLLLRQLFNNLLSNAVRYGRPGGWITITAQRTPDGILTQIANACTPVSAPTRARFFERFYRGDPAHQRSSDGSGLGLSLAREIARAHGGDLRLQDSAADEIRLCLSLPAAPPA